MIKRLIVALLLLLGAHAAEGQSRWQIDTSCLKPYFHGDTAGYGIPDWDSVMNALYNPDSVMKDTCGHYRGRMGIGKLGPHFSFAGLTFPWAPAGTILETQWTTIDTFYSEIRNGFRFIYDSLCPFVIRKVHPDDTLNWDSRSVEYALHFQEYVPLDTIHGYLWMIRQKDQTFYPSDNWPPADPLYPNKSIVRAKKSKFEIFPIPAKKDVYLITDNGYDLRSVTVQDELGRVSPNIEFVRQSESMFRITLPELPAGCYFLKIENNLQRLLIVNAR